jgi:hypothetical protein
VLAFVCSSSFCLLCPERICEFGDGEGVRDTGEGESSRAFRSLASAVCLLLFTLTGTVFFLTNRYENVPISLILQKSTSG